MEKVRLYYQCSGDLPLWDFCLHAWYGARQNQIPAIKFERWEDIPNSPYHIVVGSVEESRKWLEHNGYESPEAINVRTKYYLPHAIYATCEDFLVNNLTYPVFIKPANVIKYFTGTVVKSKKEAAFILNGYRGELEVKPVVKIYSEWRVYMHKGKIKKVCNYLGNPSHTPPQDFLSEICYRAERTTLSKYNSYTVDVGYCEFVATTAWSVIEFNDAWSIGNYGLDSDQYYHFIKDRWFQLTGLLKYEDRSNR